MNDAKRRIVVVGGWYFAFAGAVLAYTGAVMLYQHELWLERSYGNRWAFRDVPTRRGSICDRQGVELVSDVPTSTLEIHYRMFRRYHPLGIVVHCAGLARGSAAPEPSYSPESVRRAFELCLQLPAESLRAERSGAERARDLRFYLGSLVAALTEGSSRPARRAVRELLDSGFRGPAVVGIGLSPAALRTVFERRLREFEALAAALAGLRCDLWRRLERLRRAEELWEHLAALPDAAARAAFVAERRAQGQLLPHSERVPWAVHRRVPYELALKLARHAEHHPGLRVLPSVDRQQCETGPAARHDWESLAPLLGSVRFEWADAEDRERREAQVAAMRPQLRALTYADPELDEDLRQQVQEGLEQRVRSHLAYQGRTGSTGIELDQDALLRGRSGIHWLLRSRARSEVGLWAGFDVMPGRDVQLTVDLRLQDALEAAMDEALVDMPDCVAAAAFVDAASGDILAVASRPRPGQRGEEVRFRLEPALSWWRAGFVGSLVKPFVLLEHLDALRDRRSRLHHADFVDCRGRVAMPRGGPFHRHELRCDHVHGEKVRDCVAALGLSCNCFFFQAVEGIGMAGLQAAYGRFGLHAGTPETVQLRPPGIPARAYTQPRWGGAGPHRLAIGYGIECNVLQMARAYAGLARGRLPDLSLVRRPAARETGHDLLGDTAAADWAVVWDGMRFCVTSGTARSLDLEGVYGKTGTAELSATRNNAWLAGFVGEPLRSRLAFAAVVYRVRSGEYGATAAGPIVCGFLDRVRADPGLAETYL